MAIPTSVFYWETKGHKIRYEIFSLKYFPYLRPIFGGHVTVKPTNILHFVWVVYIVLMNKIHCNCIVKYPFQTGLPC